MATHWKLMNVRLIVSPLHWYRPRVRVSKFHGCLQLGPLNLSYSVPHDLPADSLEKVVLDNLVKRANDRLCEMRGAG